MQRRRHIISNNPLEIMNGAKAYMVWTEATSAAVAKALIPSAARSFNQVCNRPCSDNSLNRIRNHSKRYSEISIPLGKALRGWVLELEPTKNRHFRILEP